MKAFEAKQQSINPMHSKCIQMVTTAISDGKFSTVIYRAKQPIPSEVLELLLDDGYDIKCNILSAHTEVFYTYEASWINAAENRKGEFTEQKLEPENFIKSLLNDFTAFLEESDDDDSDDETLEDILNGSVEDAFQNLGSNTCDE